MTANKFYILKAPKTWIRDFFKNGAWSWDNMTSVLVRKASTGKTIQIFGSQGSYGEIGTSVQLVSDKTCRALGYDEIIGYSKEILPGDVESYVFK